MAADRPNLDVPDVPLDAERRRRILTQAAARFRRRRRRRSGAALGIAAALVVVASVALVGRLGQTTTQVATSPRVEAGPSQHPGSTMPSVGGSTVPAGALPEPKPSDVKGGRFVHAVALDGGALVVEPAPSDVSSPTNGDVAQQQFWSTAELAGSHETIVFGFGLVTVRNPTPPQTVNDVQATYERIPAWIGFALGGEYSCPAQPVGTTTTAGAVSGPGQPEAVVLPAAGPEAASGEKPFPLIPFVYRGTTMPCSSGIHKPSTEAVHFVRSIPWTLVSLEGTTVKVSVQLNCTMTLAGEQSGGNAKTGVETLRVRVRVSAGAFSCPTNVPPQTLTVSLRPAGAPSSAQVRRVDHAPVGPVNVVQGPGIPAS